MADERNNRFLFYPTDERKWTLRVWKDRNSFQAALENVKKHFKAVLLFSKNNGNCYENLLRLCINEGWIIKKENDYEIAPTLLDMNRNLNEVYSELSFANNFLDGGWWEILVAETFQKLFGKENVLWSLRSKNIWKDGYSNLPPSSENHGKNEDDVLAVHDNRLYVVSCKAGSYQRKFAEMLGQLYSRARMLGGLQATPVFAYTYQPHNEHRAYGKLLGIRLVGFKDILDLNRFDARLNPRN